MQLHTPLVSVEWLNEHFNDDKLVILDGTIAKTFDTETEQIKNARFFDIKTKFSDITNEFPSAFPSQEQFQEEARKLGINNDSFIVVYDDKGIYSSARVWWLFKAFGFDNITVLDGGFPEWLHHNFETQKMTLYSGDKGDFTAHLQPKFMKFFKDVKHASANKTHTIVDARSAARFNSEIPEPRKGLRSGTIPNSINLPFEDLLENGVMKSEAELQSAFAKVVNKENEIIFSCGSGITACVLALGAEISGYKNISVYDGSWTEWGSLVTE